MAVRSPRRSRRIRRRCVVPAPAPAAAVRRIAADLGPEFAQIDELVGLAAQVVGHHWRPRHQRRDHRHAPALLLQRLDQRSEIAVARKQHHMVEILGQPHGVDRKLDVHVALDFAPSERIGEFLGRLGAHHVAIIVEPVDQRPDRRIFGVVHERRVVDRPHQPRPLPEMPQQPLVIDVEAERLGCGVKVGSVDE